MPRPRDPEIDRVVREAVLDLLAEGGYARATIDAVAARASIKRPAIYRRFPNRAAMVTDAVRDAFANAPLDAPETDDTRRDLVRTLRSAILQLTKSRLGGVVRALVAERAGGDVLAELLVGLERDRRRALRAVMRRAAREKLLRAGLDLEAAVDALFGAIYFRFLFTETPPKAALAEKLSDLVLRA